MPEQKKPERYFVGQLVRLSPDVSQYVQDEYPPNWISLAYLVVGTEEVPTDCNCQAKDDKSGLMEHHLRCQSRTLESVGHPQWVTIELKPNRFVRFSGAWLSPVAGQGEANDTALLQVISSWQKTDCLSQGEGCLGVAVVEAIAMGDHFMPHIRSCINPACIQTAKETADSQLAEWDRYLEFQHKDKPYFVGFAVPLGPAAAYIPVLAYRWSANDDGQGNPTPELDMAQTALLPLRSVPQGSTRQVAEKLRERYDGGVVKVVEEVQMPAPNRQNMIDADVIFVTQEAFERSLAE